MTTAPNAVFCLGCVAAVSRQWAAGGISGLPAAVLCLLPALNGRIVELDSADHRVPTQLVVRKASAEPRGAPSIQAWTENPIVGPREAGRYGKRGKAPCRTAPAGLQRAVISESGLEITDRMLYGDLLSRAASVPGFSPDAKEHRLWSAAQGAV